MISHNCTTVLHDDTSSCCPVMQCVFLCLPTCTYLGVILPYLVLASIVAAMRINCRKYIAAKIRSALSILSALFGVFVSLYNTFPFTASVIR